MELVDIPAGMEGRFLRLHTMLRNYWQYGLGVRTHCSSVVQP